MNKADQKKKLPQEGTSAASSAGESLPGALDMPSQPTIIRASGRPSYSGGGNGSPSVKYTQTHTYKPTHTPTTAAVASPYRGVNTAAEENCSIENDKINPFTRGGAVQRSPPTQNTSQDTDMSTILAKETTSTEDQQTDTNTWKMVQPTEGRERKGSLGANENNTRSLEGLRGKAETCFFARPLGKETERPCVFARPSEKESEADVSDCSLASTASTASGTRKRRQPYLCKPGKAKKTAVEDDHALDPYEATPSMKTKKDLPTVESIQNELKDCTSVDIMTRIFESISTIEKVADSSRNLRGAHAQNIRLAARSAMAAASELAQRSSNLDVEKLRKENGELRSELASLKAELTSLTVEVNCLRQRGTGAEGWAQQTGKSRKDKDPLVQRISALMDEKLAEFRAEIMPQQDARSTLGQKLEKTTGMVQSKGKTSKRSKKKQKEDTQRPQLVSDTRSEATLDAPGCLEPEQLATATWAKVVGRKTRTSASKKDTGATAGSATASGQAKKTAKTPPVPKTAAVTITLTEGATVNYATAMATAKQRVSLAECGILQVRQKKAITGGLVLEIPGPDSAKKADALAEQLRTALADMGVRIARPVKTGEIRVMDLDESIAKQDVAVAIAEAGECPEEQVKVGEIQYSASRLGTVWVRCPLTVVRKLAIEKHLRIGWVSARVRVLAPRQLQCFRCLEFGHVRKQCSNTVDRSLCCYSCGESGHKARECKSKVPKCPVCADLGRPADHRLGGDKCNPPKKARTKGRLKEPFVSHRPSEIDQLANEPAEKGNLNHCRAAQDLLLQSLAEWSVALAVVAEPYKVPNHPRWFGSVGDAVAIYWAGRQSDPPCSILERGSGYVAVEWGPLAVLGCYISPNSGITVYEAYLDELAACIRRCLPRPLIILGDFNAHSRVWGDKRDDRRGDIIQEWAAELDLRLLNQGSTSTCVRWQGESIVDLTWATPPASRMVSGWRVAEEVVTLSDHRHIVFVVSAGTSGIIEQQNSSQSQRWALKKLDRDLLVAAACVEAWPERIHGVLSDPEEEASWFRETMTRICNTSMPRCRQAKNRAVYWWSEDIAQLRRTCLRSRRQYTRARRRRRSTAEAIATAYSTYREATKLLQIAIANAKARSWRELLEGLDRDPWGRPYKMVLGKLRPWVPPLTETLEPNLVERIVDVLFPRSQNSPTTIAAPQEAWSDELDVSEEELKRAVRRLATCNTAPGPDGIPGRAWVLALEVLEYRLRHLFNSCLQSGIFPSGWKEARLVLLKKEGRPMESPSAYRPICLLDEAGKLFERIIAARLSDHLSHVGPDLSESQFGFRQGRSTVDAILCVRASSERALSRGGVALAVSLDIVNAFNSLPWATIRNALTHHNIPVYLRNIVGAYLSDRSITYTGRNGRMHRREVNCGVPQGSVLGPLLWNLAYDAVLRVTVPSGITLVCYADDTMVLAEGNTFEETSRLAERHYGSMGFLGDWNHPAHRFEWVT
ncbi:uncharacterized protein LOC123872074 [Maniola jurtina]|uniref:uncharacterized protein LOC123872074 n=1 Tax=Maniola jurtina TaxID=191418 RepID=UPI001E6870FF|nr:uncharacterized protein LOC123872074 [Maniola jurtina]